MAERGGKRVDIEDVIAVYEFGKSDAVAARKQPDVYERFIDDLEFDRQMAIAWSKGDPASRKPDYWEYWKERESLSEPTTSLDKRTEEQIAPETKEQKVVETQEQKNTIAPEEQKANEAAPVDVQEYVAKWNDNTGEKVQVANSVEEVANTEARAAIEQGVKVKGWYDTRTGEVVVYAPNVKSAEDLVLTIVHENVSHKGLRDTLGEDIYNKMCDKTWEMMDEAIRAKYESYAGVNSIKDETKRHRAAADEYIASIAEKVEKEQKLTESERSIWSEVLKAIKEFIVKLYGDVKLTEQDIASIIRVSYDRMRARGDIEANSANSGAEAKAIETARVVEAPKAENKVRKPSAKSRPVDAKKEISRLLEEEWNDAPSDVKSTIESIANTDEVIDVEDVVYATLAELRSPKTRHKLILQGDGVIKGVTEELGLPAKELQKALGVNAFATRANGGISLQKMAENIVADLDRNITGASNIDVADVRDMLIEAIQSAGEPADISYHRARRRIAMAEKLYNDWKSNKDALEETYASEIEAEHAAEELWLIAQQKAHELMGLNYLDNIFADELAERERVINKQNRISNERINERGLGSNRLLRSQQTDPTGRVEESSDRRGIQEEVGDVVSWVQNAEAQRGQANSVAEREIRVKEVDFGKERTRLNTRLEEIDSRLTDTRVVDQLQADVDKAIAIYGGAENIPKELYSDLLSRSNAIREETEEFYREKYEIEEQLRVLDKNEKTAIKEAEREAKLAEIEKKYSGFLSGKSRVEQGRVDKVLSKPIRYNGVAMTKGQMIEALIDEGVRFEPSSINGKKIYIARTDDNSYYEITKTEYEYARHLGGKTLTQEEAAKAEQKLRYETLRKKYSGLISVKGDLDRRIAWLERALKGGNPNNTAGKKMQAELAELRELKDLSEGSSRFRVESLVGDEKIFEGMRKLEEGETSHVERVFTENKNFEFTTKNRIESYDDVAYIFKELENEAVENTFVALVKDGKPTVIHLGMGTATASMVDFISANVAVRRINPDKIYFVHNHPSGMLKASQQDMNILDAMKNAFGENVVQDGIIINTFSGKYGTFGAYGDIESSDIPRDQEEFPIKVHSFSKSVYDRGYKPTPAKSSTDIAAFITSQRLGERPKIGMIVANNQLQIIGNIFLPYSEFTEENADAIANDIAYYTSVMGGNAAFLFGNAKLSEIEGKGLRSKVEYRANKQIRLLDYIEVDGGRHKSANDDGVRFRFSETEEEFRATQKEAVEKKGIVMPNLNSAVVEIVDVPQHHFKGTLKEARKEAKEWAIKNYSNKEFLMPDNRGMYEISRNAIKKYIDKTAIDESDNPSIHLSALTKLPEIISNSITGEIHADYKKDENDDRKLENGIDSEDLLVHRLYGAIDINGIVYRVKTTMQEYVNVNKANTPHSYEVTKIELLEDRSATRENYDHRHLNRSNSSIDGAKLLDGVEKSYDKGKFLLEESKNLDNLTTTNGDVDKDEQLRIIQETNPAPNDVNTWVRSVDDIKTFEEALKDSDYAPYAGEDFDDSYTWDIVEDALRSGEIEVYSSKPIVNGAFVTPSRMEAESYGDGNVYRARVQLSDVAWIDPTQGQLATNNEVDYKRAEGKYRFRVGEEDDYSGEGGVRFAVVEDEELINRLDADEKVIGYRNVVLNEDGTFESPMANSLRSTDRKAKEKTGGFELNKWERSEERPHLVDENGKITLVKPDGKAVEKVDYNPYIHNRLNRVNKQFKQAWERPNLVYIKTEIPLSDLESGYHAEKAKLPVGEHKWNGGNLILSRYDKPVEICDWNDVADDWQASFKKKGINFDIIPPALLPILEERGMKIIRPHKNMGDACNKAYADWAEARGIDTKGFWAEVAKEKEEAERAKAEKKAKKEVKKKAKKEVKKKAEGGVRFRFIGEQGAKSMDKKEGTTARMDNLAVAKKMLSEYSYKEVKMATGWEQGMDGKWRYETPDFEQFDIHGNLKFVQRHPDYARYRELVKKSKKSIDKYNIKMHRRVQEGSPMLCFIGGRGVDSSYSGDDWCSLLTKEQKYKLWELKLRELLLILWVIL